MFEKVLDVLESQRFDMLPNSRPDGHTIIGIMSPLERACSTVLQEVDAKIISKIVALGDCQRGTPSIRCLDNVVVELEICPFAKNILAIKAEYPHQSQNILRRFMFTLIGNRMLAFYPSIEDVDLSRNFVITTSTEMDPPETIEMFENFEELSLEETLTMSIKGTFLEQIIAVAEAGEFVDETTVVKDHELFVREMTTLEKACWTVYSNYYDACKKLSDERNALHEGDAFECFGSVITISLGSDDDSSAEGLYIPKDENHPDVLRTIQISEELQTIETKMEPLKKFLWNMIASGIPKNVSDGHSNRGIRTGFKVVVYNK